jgi:flagellar biosynthesis anti-sigma factor FlgM
MKVQAPPRGVAQVPDKSSVSGPSQHKVEKQSGERVSVSRHAQMLAEATAKEDINTEKVEKLRESIRVKAFEVDHEQVAKTMVEEELY